MPPHIVLPNGMWRFVKKGRKVAKTKKRMVVKMVRRKGGFRKRAGGFISGGGGLKTMIAPVLGGVADSYLDPMLPIDGIGGTAVGFFLHSPTVRDIGLYKVGMSLGNILPLPWRGTTSGGGL